MNSIFDRRKNEKMKWHICPICKGKIYNHRPQSHIWKNGDFTSFTLSKGFCDKNGNWNNEHIAVSHFELVRFKKIIDEVLKKYELRGKHNETNKN